MNTTFLSSLFLCILFAAQVNALDVPEGYSNLFTKGNGIALALGCSIAVTGLIRARAAYFNLYKEQGMLIPHQQEFRSWKIWQKLSGFELKGEDPCNRRKAYYDTALKYFAGALIVGGFTKIGLDSCAEAY